MDGPGAPVYAVHVLGKGQSVHSLFAFCVLDAFAAEDAPRVLLCGVQRVGHKDTQAPAPFPALHFVVHCLCP